MKRALTALLGGPSIVLIAPAPAIGAQLFLREAEAPRAIFGEGAAATKKILNLTDTELAALSNMLGRKPAVRSYPYLEVSTGQGPIGLIFVLDVIGQSQPITFAVGVMSDGALQDVQVMVYREPQGEGIQEKRFRKQFIGKRLKDPIALGKDIDAISGATISSRSASFAARKGLALSELLRARTASGGKP